MAGLLTLKCPTCGAKLHYDKSAQILTCEYCGNVHLLEASGQPLPTSYALPKRDWIRVGDYEIFLHEVLDDQVNDQRVVYINIEYTTQRTNQTLSCRRNQWLLFDQEYYSYEAEGSNKALYEDKQRPFFGGERFLNRGMRARGWLAFKVPPAAQLKRLQFFTSFLSARTVDILLDGGGE